MPSVLIAEDDPIQREVVSQILARDLQVETHHTTNGQEALNFLKSDNGPRMALALMDLRMPVMDGFSLLRQTRKLYPRLPCIVMTSSLQLEDAVEVMQAGAIDFITKPLERQRLVTSVRNSLALHTLRQEVSKHKYDRFPRYDFDDIENFSPGLRDVCTLARRGATSSTIPILITGESGAGKEVIAHAIHRESDRFDKPFISVNCGALPENLVESILFGHEKGSFTGAIAKSLGKCREANGGVLFLDEVGELKADAQVKLLRMLQEGEVEPVGAARAEKVNVRVISATNRSLEEMVAKGTFREDLYYRLNGLPLRMPSLRERVGDIPLLASHILERLATLEQKDSVHLSASAIDWLKNHKWPGNVRELQHLLARALLLSDGAIITADDLSRWTHSTRPITTETTSQMHSLLRDASGNFRQLKDIEDEIFDQVLDHFGGHYGRAAAALGIGQSTLYKRIRKDK